MHSKESLAEYGRSDDVSQPFLPSDPEEQDHRGTHSSSSSLKGLISRYAYALHVTFAIIYTVICLLVVVQARQGYSDKTVPESPLDNVRIRSEKVVFHNISSGMTPFAGPAPNSMIDSAWEDLLSPIHMRVTEDEMSRAGSPISIGLPEGGGYLIWLGVFHELHCIKMLREWIYRDHYHSGKSPAEMAHLSSHADHCLEMLRLSSMCHADLSLTNFKWIPESTQPMFDASESSHQCTDWQALTDSLRGRIVPMEEIRRLRNPLLPDQER